MEVQNIRILTRRTILRAAMSSALLPLVNCSQTQRVSGAEQIESARLRGLVVVLDNLTLENWPQRAKQAGLNCICLHHASSPQKLIEFMATDLGQAYLEQCLEVGIEVEFDFHAMRDLVPRELFSTDPTFFCMDQNGNRTAVRNFCVHSKSALELAAENALAIATKLPTTTNCYYYWSDGCAAWCRCPRCRELSDSDQLLVVENCLAAALRRDRPAAQVAHLACHASMPRPTKIKPAPGVFLHFAPGRRRYDIPYSQQREENQVDSLWFLQRNLEVFPIETSQVLEYWLDVTHFGVGEGPLPWNRERFLGDLAAYRSLGLRHFKSFGNGINAQYHKRHTDLKFLREFAEGLAQL